MRLWRSVCGIALLALCRKLLAAPPAVNDTVTNSSVETEDFLTQMKKRDNFMLNHNKMMRIFERGRKCNLVRDSNYLCNRECHVSVLPEADASTCSVGTNTEYHHQCYGQQIAYNHTLNVTAMKQLDRFNVLRRFPQCWSKLAPLICAVTFRPCQRSKIERTLQYEDKNNSPSANETEVIRIVYQIFSKNFCADAMRECAFAIESGMWPEFIDCGQQIDRKHLNIDVPLNETSAVMPKIFGDKCTTRYSSLKNPTFESECVWPLVGINDNLTVTMRPVIDRCYLPCSPLFESEDIYVKSRWMNSTIAMFFTVTFAAIGLYLWLFSQAYLERYEIFLLTQAFLCAIVYYSTWALLSIDHLADASVCSADGVARLEMARIRLSDFRSLSNLFSLCAIEAALFLCTPLCAFAWLNAFLVYRCWASDFRSSDFILYWNEGGNEEAAIELTKCDRRATVNQTIGARRALIMGIYSLGVAIALLAVVAFEVPVDGIMRVCHFGAQISQTSNNLYLTYIPLLVMNLSFTAVVIVRYFSKRRVKNSKNLYKAAIPPANALNAASSSSEQSSSSENPLILSKSSRRGESEKQQRHFLALRYSLVHYSDRRRKSIDTSQSVLDDGSGRSVVGDRSVAIIFLSNLAFCCLSLYTLLNISEFSGRDERNTILDSILCSLRSQAATQSTGNKWSLNDSAASCKMRRLHAVGSFLISAMTLVAPALPFFTVFCCVFCTLLRGGSREAKFLRLIRRNVFRSSNSDNDADVLSVSSMASNSKISLKRQNSTNGLLENRSCKSYEKLSSIEQRNQNQAPQHSPTANSTNDGELSEKIQLLLENQILLQQQIQQQRQRMDSSPIFFDSSSAVYLPHGQVSPPMAAGWPNPAGGYFPFVNSSTPLSVSPMPSSCCLSPIPLPYCNPVGVAVAGGQGMAPPVYSLPPSQQTYFIPAAPPSPSTQYALWNPYGRFLSASHGDVNAADGYPIRQEAYDPGASPTNVASSMANSDPIHKSGERKIDLNRNYRTHVIHKLMHEKYQKRSEKSSLFPEEAASMLSGNSSTTLNMTSVSQQPSVVPAVHPAVASALYEFFKQGVEHGEHKMKHRMEEMTNVLNQYNEQLKQLIAMPSTMRSSMGTLMEMGPLSSSATSSGHHQQHFVPNRIGEESQPIQPQIPMIFGAEGQRQMREYKKRNSAEISSVSCPNYFHMSEKQNGGDRHAHTVVGEFTSSVTQKDNDTVKSDNQNCKNETSGCINAIVKSAGGELDDDTSCDENASDFYASDEMGEETEDGEETEEDVDGRSIARSGLSDDFNSDASDPEEEKIYNIQMERLKKTDPEKLATQL